MCSIMLGAIGIGAVSLISGALGTISSYGQAQSQAAAAEQQAKQAEYNADLEYKRAQNIRIQSETERAQLKQKYDSLLGTARATYGASGVAAGSGSAMRYEEDWALAYASDRANLDYEIDNRIFEAHVSGDSYKNTANSLFAQSNSIRSGAGITAATGLLGSVASGVTAGFSGYQGLSAISSAFGSSGSAKFPTPKLFNVVSPDIPSFI